MVGLLLILKARWLGWRLYPSYTNYGTCTWRACRNGICTNRYDVKWRAAEEALIS